MNAFGGAIGVAELDGILSPAYAVCRPKVAINSHYYHHLFRTPIYKGLFSKSSYGIMYERNRLYFENFKAIYALFPPIQEQQDIVRFIDSEGARIEDAVAHAQREIELIKEYRTTLISDVVTGKIDVRTEVPEEVIA